MCGIINVMSELSGSPPADEVGAANITFYADLWSGARLHQPRRFNTWPLVESLVAKAPNRLEIGPGMRPRLPIAGTCFVDLNETAAGALSAAGGYAGSARLTQLPFGADSFDLVAAFDILEHVPDDTLALTEITRVLRAGGLLLLSVPLHPSRWTEFDAIVGHYRRYLPADLTDLLAKHGYRVERSALFGMQPKNTALVKFGMDRIRKGSRVAMAVYNWLIMPLAAIFQKPLRVQQGLIDTTNVDEIILVCRKRAM